MLTAWCMRISYCNSVSTLFQLVLCCMEMKWNEWLFYKKDTFKRLKWPVRSLKNSNMSTGLSIKVSSIFIITFFPLKPESKEKHHWHPLTSLTKALVALQCPISGLHERWSLICSLVSGSGRDSLTLQTGEQQSWNRETEREPSEIITMPEWYTQLNKHKCLFDSISSP